VGTPTELLRSLTFTNEPRAKRAGSIRC
jgi:hypothetical protein